MKSSKNWHTNRLIEQHVMLSYRTTIATRDKKCRYMSSLRKRFELLKACLLGMEKLCLMWIEEFDHNLLILPQARIDYC
jgi:hypothetical protein